MWKKKIGKDQALQKIRHYCAYQERSHREVRERLYQYGLSKAEVEELIAKVIDEDYLNEERYAIALAGGKWRIKRWGRRKIIQALQAEQISAYCIKKALQEIDETEYKTVMQELGSKKWDNLGEDTFWVRLRKTQDYLLQKGFEPELVTPWLQSLSRTSNEDRN